MADNDNLKKQTASLSEDEMDCVTGGCVNRFETGSIPQQGGLGLDPVNTSKDIEELGRRNTPLNPFPQNCG